MLRACVVQWLVDCRLGGLVGGATDGTDAADGGGGGGGNGGGVHMKEQLIYLSKLLDFEVSFLSLTKRGIFLNIFPIRR